MKAGGSATITSKRSSLALSSFRASNTSPSMQVIFSAKPFSAALRSTPSRAKAEASTQNTSLAPNAAACTPQPPM
ncbi:hypothetical protein D3C78_1887650 [compost metagenome]